MERLKVTFLGTGTSQGIPVIGCDCPVCTSDDPRDKRLRTAALLQIGNVNIAIDSGPDFRQQILRTGIDHLDAILITHEHNDHIIGMDDVRPFNFMTGKDMPVYATQRVQKELQTRFAYIFAKENRYPGAPMVVLHDLDPQQPLTVAGIDITPIEVMHGQLPIVGFRVRDFAYLTDMRTITDEEFEKLKGVKTVAVSALHHRPHHTHMNLEQSLAFVERLQPERAYFIHMSHRMGKHAEVSQQLPEHVFFAYDDLTITM